MMKISKIREVNTPTRGTEKSAGIDFYVPNLSSETFANDLVKANQHTSIVMPNHDKILLPAHTRILIPSGIKVEVPKNHALIAFNKSGVSSKLGLDLLASVVDEDYQGEIHISIYNTTNNPIVIESGQKIIQFLLVPVRYDEIDEVPIEELHCKKTKRGIGGFGSTGG